LTVATKAASKAALTAVSWAEQKAARSVQRRVVPLAAKTAVLWAEKMAVNSVG
jgi:hypothetical protein